MSVRDLSFAHALHEGYFGNSPIGVDDTKAYKNNNPGNLRFAGQTGAIGQDATGFAVFSTPEAGWVALDRQIFLNANRNLTLEEHIKRYAPSNENNTEAYIKGMEKVLGVSRQKKLSEIIRAEYRIKTSI